MALDLRKIRYFVAVYEEGSLSRAAARERVAQPALSVRIRDLEADLSTRLFDRTAQGVHPTPAGHHLHRLCVDLMRGMAALRQEMLDFGGAVAGTLRVGLMSSICRGPLAGILAAYIAANPNVEVTVLEGYSSALGEGVLAGDLDLAICNRPARQTGLKLRLLLRDRVVLVSGRARALTPWAATSLDDLRDTRLVLPSARNSFRRLLERTLRQAAVRPARVMDMDGLGATMGFVEATDWSTLVPSVAVQQDARFDRLTINPLAPPLLISDIYEVRAADRPLSLPGERFVSLVADELARPSPLPFAPDRV